MASSSLIGFLVVLVNIAIAAAPAPTPSPGGGSDPMAEIPAGLEWKFELRVYRDGNERGYYWRSSKPISESKEGKTFLHFSVSETTFPTAEQAEAAFAEIAAGADPNTGLSYGWDTVALDGARILHLSAPCLFSPANFKKIEQRLDAAIGRPAARTLCCSCGSRCRQK